VRAADVSADQTLDGPARELTARAGQDRPARREPARGSADRIAEQQSQHDAARRAYGREGSVHHPDHATASDARE
jgi:hypothetical protein